MDVHTERQSFGWVDRWIELVDVMFDFGRSSITFMEMSLVLLQKRPLRVHTILCVWLGHVQLNIMGEVGLWASTRVKLVIALHSDALKYRTGMITVPRIAPLAES